MVEGFRDISRVLEISPNTVLRVIRQKSAMITQPNFKERREARCRDKDLGLANKSKTPSLLIHDQKFFIKNIKHFQFYVRDFDFKPGNVK